MKWRKWEELSEEEAAEQHRMIDERHELVRSYDEEPLLGFASETACDTLSGRSSSNVCFSPLSAYFALGMSAMGMSEGTEGAACALLGIPCKTGVANNLSTLHELVESNGMLGEMSLSSSVWADSDKGYRLVPSYKKALAGIGAEAREIRFSDGMAAGEIDKWVSAGSEGFLPFAPFDCRDAAAIVANVLHFKGGWSDRFPHDMTRIGIFHSPEGDVAAEFMHDVDDDGSMFFGNGFSMAIRPLGQGRMCFVLPDEDVDVESLFDSPEKVRDMLGYRKLESRNVIVEWSVPKFDVSDSLDLSDCLDGLDSGMSKADLSGMLEGSFAESGTLISFEQRARLSIDEDGCEAAAFSTMAWACLGVKPSEKIDFTLDRPFAFLFMESLHDGEDNRKDIPLFMGIVCNPASAR